MPHGRSYQHRANKAVKLNIKCNQRAKKSITLFKTNFIDSQNKN